MRNFNARLSNLETQNQSNRLVKSEPVEETYKWLASLELDGPDPYEWIATAGEAACPSSEF